MADQTKSVFAARLTALRHGRALSQPQLADVTGIGKTTIQRLSCDETEPTAGNLVRLAQYFGCTIDYLCGLSDCPERLPPGKWVVDDDRLAEAKGGKPIRWERESLGVPIPQRARIVDSTTYYHLVGELQATCRAAKK